MGVPYEGSLVGVVVDADGRCFDVVSGPPRGTLHKLLVRQMTGNLDGYSVRVFNSEWGCQGDSGSSEADQLHYDLHQILPEQTAAPGSAGLAVFEPSGYPYNNMDGTPTNPVRKLWVSINPLGAGEKTFDLAWTTVDCGI